MLLKKSREKKAEKESWMERENSRAWWNNCRYLSTMDQTGGSHSSALVANLLWGVLGTCQTHYTFPVQSWLWRQVWGQVGRPVPRLESRLAQDAAKHRFSCNVAQARSSDKHLRLNEIHEHCLHVKYCSLSPAWVTRGCPSLIEDNSLDIWAVILSLY